MHQLRVIMRVMWFKSNLYHFLKENIYKYMRLNEYFFFQIKCLFIFYKKNSVLINPTWSAVFNNFHEKFFHCRTFYSNFKEIFLAFIIKKFYGTIWKSSCISLRFNSFFLPCVFSNSYIERIIFDWIILNILAICIKLIVIYCSV